jgi:hypothetical protein
LFVASVAGMLALTFVYKLHNADPMLDEVLVLKFLVAPFFSTQLSFTSTNVMILFFISIMTLLMLS